MKRSAPLTKSQYGIYVECASHNGEPCYNLPYIYVLDGSLDGNRLLDAVETAFKAHPTLFTRITVGDDGEPVQTIDMAGEQWSLAIEDIQDIEQEKRRLVRPFNIYGDRLFHVGHELGKGVTAIKIGGIPPLGLVKSRRLATGSLVGGDVDECQFLGHDFLTMIGLVDVL